MKIFVCISILAISIFAKDSPNPADFPLKVQVISYAEHTETEAAVTRCRDTSIPGPYAKTSQCVTSSADEVIREIQLQVGDSDYKVACDGSRCSALAPGKYAGRWKDANRLDILSLDSHGSLKAHTYKILGATQVAGSRSPSQSPCSAGASVEIHSTPGGADISVDGKFVGSTPSSLELSGGDHEIDIEKSGFKQWQRMTHVTGGKVTISADLDKAN